MQPRIILVVQHNPILVHFITPKNHFLSFFSQFLFPLSPLGYHQFTFIALWTFHINGSYNVWSSASDFFHLALYSWVLFHKVLLSDPGQKRGFPGGSVVKNPPAMPEMQVQSLGLEDPLEKGMATQFSIFTWEIPWTEETGGLQSMGLQKRRTWFSE